MSCSNKEQNSKAISRKISFSEIPIKDNVNLFQSNEMPHSSSTNYQNFQQSNIHNNKDQYFNFNLKTLPTDSIEDINMNKSRLLAGNNLRAKNKTFKLSEENMYKITSSDLIDMENRNQTSPQNQIFISQNYISTNSVDDVETSQRIHTIDNIKSEPNNNIFNNNINNRYGQHNDIMKATLNTLKYISINEDGINDRRVNSIKETPDFNINKSPSSSNSKFIINKQLLTSISPKSGLNETNFQHYNQELSYYRKTIEQMQNEIGLLTCKISEMEKNKTLFSDGLKTNTINKEENIPSQRNQTLEDKIKQLETIVINLANVSRNSVDTNRLLLSPVKEHSYNFIVDDNKYKKSESTSNNLPKKETRIIRYNESKYTNISKANRIRSKSENKIKSNVPDKKQRKQSPNFRILTTKPSIEKINKSKKSSINNSMNNEEVYLLKEENKKLKDRLNDLEQYISNKEEGGEVLIWKKKCDILANNYLEAINSLRNQLRIEKINLSEQVRALNIDCNKQVETIAVKYKGFFDEYEKNINKLKKENEELRKKFSKVKNILNTSRTDL